MTVYLIILKLQMFHSVSNQTCGSVLGFLVSRGRKEENVTGSHHAVAARAALLSCSNFMDALQC